MLNRIKEFLDARPDPISGTEYTSAYRFWQETGIGRDTAYRMYNDSTYIPTSKVLNKICNTYRIQPGSFIVWEPDDELGTAMTEQEELDELSQQQNPSFSTDRNKYKSTHSFIIVIPSVPDSA